MAERDVVNSKSVADLTRPGVLSAMRDAWSAFSSVIFGPGDPMTPMGTSEPEPTPRAWQYPVAGNLSLTPRAIEKLTAFEVLRYLADSYDIARICISRQTQAITATKWAIVPRNPEDKMEQHATDIAEVTAFFDSPDRVNSWRTWLTMALEDVLVIDALTLFPRRDRGGRLFALELVDGATIKPLVDVRGMIPQPPAPAYQQILYGVPWSEWHAAMGYEAGEEGPNRSLPANRLLYLPMNARANSMYGRSPLEWIILTVNAALRRQHFDLAYYSDGNVPEGIMGLPESYTVDQIREFEEYWNAITVGNIKARRRLRFVPITGSGTVPVYEFKKAPESDAMMLWLLKVTCSAFGMTPPEIGFTDDVNRATATSQENVIYRTRDAYLEYLADVLNRIIRVEMGKPHLAWSWVEKRPEEDQLKQAQADEIRIRSGVISIDDVRSRLGLPPIGVEPFVTVGSTPVLVKDLATFTQAEPPTPEPVAAPVRVLPAAAETRENDDDDDEEDDADVQQFAKIAANTELRQWRKVALRAINKGAAPTRPFVSTAIDPAMVQSIRAWLASARTPAEVRSIFSVALREPIHKSEALPTADIVSDTPPQARVAEEDIAAAIADWDERFPKYAGLLRAEVEGDA